MEPETKSNIKIAVIAIILMGAVFFGSKMNNGNDTHGHNNGEVHKKH
jgi:Na+/H+ antiporter NhaC